jgi:hypothetical protein
MLATGAAMISLTIVFFSLCSPASASDCDLKAYDRTPPPALRGTVNNPAANFEYASDVDAVDGQLQISNYILNRRTDKGIGVKWPKAGISQSVTFPIPPGDSACSSQTTEKYHTESDIITYGTNEGTKATVVFVADTQRKLGSTESNIKTSYTNSEGKPVNVNVEVFAFRTEKEISFSVQHSPALVIGIAGLPDVLTAGQIETLQESAKAQNAGVKKATFFQYTNEDPTNALAALFDPERGPSAKTDFLFFSGSSAKFGITTSTSNIEKVSADMIVLDAKSMRPILGTGVSLFVPVMK